MVHPKEGLLLELNWYLDSCPPFPAHSREQTFRECHRQLCDQEPELSKGRVPNKSKGYGHHPKSPQKAFNVKSLCCPPETNTVCQLYFDLKNELIF